MLQTQMISCTHHATCACWQASHPSVLKMCCKIFIHLLFTQAKGLLLELTASHFNSLNTKFANENMMKKILITV